jgi:hypothetical protein
VQGLGGNFNHGEQLTQNTVDWTFADSKSNPMWIAGIAFNNDSVYTTGNPPAPQGLQVGFVQGDSSISQTVTLGKGTYMLTLAAAQSARNQTPQALRVLVDGSPVGIIKPEDTTYQLFTVEFTVGAGKHTITFQGTTKSDSTVLIDEIACRPTSSLPQPGGEKHRGATTGTGNGEHKDFDQWRATLERLAAELIWLEGTEMDAGLDHIFAAVHRLTAERRLSVSSTWAADWGRERPSWLKW